jgi:cyclic di-GMP phosphodiesterase
MVSMESLIAVAAPPPVDDGERARHRHRRSLERAGTVCRLATVFEQCVHETGAQADRQSRYAALLAMHVGLDPESMRLATAMRDVGNVGVAGSILRKPSALTVHERREMEGHAEIGFTILGGSGAGQLELAATIALTHHERFGGGGYPHGLSGDEIPFEGQIAAIADVFGALTSDRPHRNALSVGEATEVMRGERGVHFNPDLLDTFLALIDETVSSARADALRRAVRSFEQPASHPLGHGRRPI